MTISINNMKRTVVAPGAPTKVVPVAVDEKFVLDGVVSTLALPAGPYIKVAVTGLRIVLFGQELSGDFSFEKVTDVGDDGAFGGTNVGAVHNADTTVTRITLANVGLRLGTPERDFVIVSNGHGELVIVTGGVYGVIAATVVVDIPNVSVGGTSNCSSTRRSACRRSARRASQPRASRSAARAFTSTSSASG